MIIYGYVCSLKKSKIEFAIVVVYVDSMNLIGTPKELSKTVEYLKKYFKFKNLGKIKLCLDLELEHKENRIFIHKSAYIEKVLKQLIWKGSNEHPYGSMII